MSPDLQLFLQAWNGDPSCSDADHQRILERFRNDAAFREDCLSEIQMLALCKTAQSPPPRWLGLLEALDTRETTESSRKETFEQGVMARIHQQETPQKRRMGWNIRSRMRPWAAAAAGLMAGILGASVVWACAMPLWPRATDEVIPLLKEGFERSDLLPGRGVPTSANQWSGDLEPVSASDIQISAAEGGHLARLNPVARRKLSYAWLILDLAEIPPSAPGDMRQLEVSASFNREDSADRSRYQIRLAAFSQEPAEIRDIWNNEPVLFDSVLQHVGRNVLTRKKESGWRKVSASLDIPPGTRSLLVSLAAGSRDETASHLPHYLDDVQIQIRTRPTLH